MMNQILSHMDAIETAPADALATLAAATSITANDVSALRRSGLTLGIPSREDAEMLIAIERGPARKCREWGDLLVESLLDYVVWSERPTGILTEMQATWLCDQVGEKPTPACLALLVAVLEEASTVPSWFGPAVRVKASQVFAPEAGKAQRKAA